jgi:hypothetical protein
MNRLLAPFLLAAALLGAFAWAEPPPTRAAMRKTFAANRSSVVAVEGSWLRLGVVVGNSGQVLTAVSEKRIDASARVSAQGEWKSARVLASHPRLGVALLGADELEHISAVPVRLVSGVPSGMWLLAIRLSKTGQPEPALVQVREESRAVKKSWVIDRRLPPGAPLFDSKGHLVALAAAPEGAYTRAVPLSLVKSLLEAQPQ